MFFSQGLIDNDMIDENMVDAENEESEEEEHVPTGDDDEEEGDDDDAYWGQEEEEYEEDVPEELHEHYDKCEEAYFGYLEARKRMRDLATARSIRAHACLDVCLIGSNTQ